MSDLFLGGSSLTLENVYEVAFHSRKVSISPECAAKIQSSQKYLEDRIKKNETLYGINTGFGNLSNIRIPTQDLEQLQYNILRSHACGVGPSLDEHIVRAMLLLRAHSLSLGHSGVSVALVQQLLNLLNANIIPLIPEQGSVGASGDLAPLAHLGLVLIGEGHARYQNQEMSGGAALLAAGLQPLKLGPKEGLALINGTQLMSAIGTLNLLSAEQLCWTADLVSAMSLEACRGSHVPFDPLIHAVRPHRGQILVAQNMHSILMPEKIPSEISKSHQNCKRVQDPYSFRCIPQVHGATRDALTFVRQVFETEINSVSDNPLVFENENKILSGGNFHGQILSIASDVLSIATAELASISEQRLEKLINPLFSELPAFLTPHGGLNSGFMIVQVTAASLVSENKTLCHPASVDSIPTSTDKEDHVSMGAWAARKAARVLANSHRVLELELLAAAQAIDFLRPLKTSTRLEKAHSLIRQQIPKLETDRTLSEDFKKMAAITRSQIFIDLTRTILPL